MYASALPDRYYWPANNAVWNSEDSGATIPTTASREATIITNKVFALTLSIAKLKKGNALKVYPSCGAAAMLVLRN